MSLKLVKKLAFIFILFSSLLYSQTKILVVDSETNEPIANVFLFTKYLQIFSDSEGYFSTNNFSENDTITLKHFKYNTLTQPLTEFKNLFIIQLIPKVIKTEQILIFSPDAANSSNYEKIKLDKFEKSTFSSVSEIIKNKTSLLVKDYGGESGTKTISSRGMSGENTTVLFNEARINDLRTGTFDISTLDIFAIDQIEYIKNNSLDGNYSSGGTIKLYSGNLENSNSIILGGMFNNIQSQKYFTQVNYANNGFSFGANFSRAFSQNEFKYLFNGNELYRKNANYSKTFVNGDVKWSNNNIVLKFYTHYSHLLNGLPGFVVTNNTASSKARNLTNSFLSIGNVDYSFSKNILFSSTISFHNQYLKIFDPQNQLLIDRDSQSSTFKDFSFANKLIYNFNKGNLLLGYSISYSNLDSLTNFVSGIFNSNNGIRKEQNIFTSANYKVNTSNLAFVNFIVGINYQMIRENILDIYDHNYLSFKIGLSFTPLVLKDTEINISYSNNYRHPTFNERYYSSFYGNNNLQGEKYKSLNFGFSTKLEIVGNEEFNISYFSIEGNNRIVWAPTIFAIQIPRNISKIKSDGIEFRFRQSLFNSTFDWELFYTYTNARNFSALSKNDNTYNKLIIYTPLNRLNINAEFNFYNFRLSANSSFISKRFYTPDNTLRNSLPSYFILDLSLAYQLNISSTENIISLNAYNILDEEYFIIQSYPMPLKTISINYSMRIQ